MSQENVERAELSDAPPTAAVHQRDVASEAAEARGWDHAAVLGRTVTINRPREELYAFWRDFRNLATFMENVQAVTSGDGQTSHWVIKAPAGKTVEWDSILVEDIPGELIAWESAEGADIKNTGRIEFRDNTAGRGTEVSATIVYEPPAGDLGKLVAKLFQKEPKIQARRELRRFKQLMETGEIPVAFKEDDSAVRGSFS
jgi:uncharacterized membrane protein